MKIAQLVEKVYFKQKASKNFWAVLYMRMRWIEETAKKPKEKCEQLAVRERYFCESCIFYAMARASWFFSAKTRLKFKTLVLGLLSRLFKSATTEYRGTLHSETTPFAIIASNSVSVSREWAVVRTKWRRASLCFSLLLRNARMSGGLRERKAKFAVNLRKEMSIFVLEKAYDKTL